jgi:hypothetical protein
MLGKIAAGALAMALALLAVAPASLAQDSWEGLQKVPSKSLDEAWLLPGADFTGYRKVLLDPVEVSFRKGWERDINRASPPSARPRVTAEDAERIRQWMREDFAKVLVRDLAEAGFELTDTPGPDVLRLTPVLMNVYLNGPDAFSQPGRVDVYTFEAGAATLAIEARDASLGTLLGRAVDERRTGDDRVLQWSTEVTNRSEFGQVFSRWSGIVVDGLRTLRIAPPAVGP